MHIRQVHPYRSCEIALGTVLVFRHLLSSPGRQIRVAGLTCPNL